MITLMRRNRKTLQVGLLAVIAVFVATSVFVFGSGSLRGDSGDAVAKVNGEAITADRYQRRYQEFINAYTATLRDRFSPDMAERMGVPQQVIQDLVQEELIVQRARAERLEVSDEELNARIHAIPHFQENGHFSLKRYEEVLRRAGLGKTVFEADIRRRLTRIKLEEIVRRGVKLTEGEIAQAFAYNREEVRASWALVELAPIIATMATTDVEIEAYLKDHAAEFRLPERRKVQYVIFAPKDFTRPVSDAEVEKYYTEHSAEFQTPRQSRAAHILARVGETGGSEAEDRARAKIADVIRRVKVGEDFAKLAKELSEDRVTAENGGDLGLVGPGEIVAAFEAALVTLKKGEVSPAPVRTPFGYHAIKVSDVREGGKKPLREVASQIRERLQADVVDQATKAKAEEMRAKLLSAPDFMAQAKSLGLSPVEVMIPRRDRTAGLTQPDPVEDTVFELIKGNVSTPVKTPAGLMVLKTVDDLPAAVPPLAEIKDKVAASVKRRKAETAAFERAKMIATEARASDFVTAARKLSATVGEPARFSRAKPADKLPGDVMNAALQVPVDATASVRTPQGVYVLKVLERFPADMKELGADREKLTKEVLAKKQGQAWVDWLTAARAEAKIEVSPARFQPRRS